MTQPPGPLGGLRIIELAGLGPAPFAGMVLADLGARVLRVERPGRAPITPDAAPPEVHATNPYDVLNRSRDAVAVDLRDPDGLELVRDLLDGADVLVEGFRPGVLERLGLDPQDCLRRNPRLVVARMTGWGQDGPLRDRVGHDLNYLAQAGVLAHLGRRDQPPTPPLNLVADFGGGGMLLVVGVLAALVERGISGRGQVVDAAMVDGAALLMGPLFGAWSSGFWSVERGTNLLDSGAPFYDCYECADGGWMAVAAIEAPFFAELVRVLGVAGDPAVADQHDQAGWPAMRSLFASAFSRRTRREWTDGFHGVDACVSPVLSMGEAPLAPAAAARAAFVELDGVHQPAPAPRFSRTPAPPPRATPVGGDPLAVLDDWGIDPVRGERLLTAGVID